MARPKSEDKRNAILSAATQIFAERGIGAPTSAISGAAGVAEGTLFTYFKTKDELVNALYRELKLDLADAMMASFPVKKGVRERLKHVWDHYVAWGVAHPAEQKVLAQLKVSGSLTEESKAAGFAPFAAIQKIADDAKAQQLLKDFPLQFVAAAMGTLAETTMEFVRLHPNQAAMYRNAGFEILWSGIEYKR